MNDFCLCKLNLNIPDILKNVITLKKLMTLHKYFKIVSVSSYIPTIISKDLCHDYKKNLFWLSKIYIF